MPMSQWLIGWCKKCNTKDQSNDAFGQQSNMNFKSSAVIAQWTRREWECESEIFKTDNKQWKKCTVYTVNIGGTSRRLCSVFTVHLDLFQLAWVQVQNVKIVILCFNHKIDGFFVPRGEARGTKKKPRFWMAEVLYEIFFSHRRPDTGSG